MNGRDAVLVFISFLDFTGVANIVTRDYMNTLYNQAVQKCCIARIVNLMFTHLKLPYYWIFHYFNYMTQYIKHTVPEPGIIYSTQLHQRTVKHISQTNTEALFWLLHSDLLLFNKTAFNHLMCLLGII